MQGFCEKHRDGVFLHLVLLTKSVQNGRLVDFYYSNNKKNSFNTFLLHLLKMLLHGELDIPSDKFSKVSSTI